MKAFVTTLLSIVCLVILIIGNIHWNNKTNIQANEKIVETKLVEKVRKDDPNADTKLTKSEKSALSKLASKWPEEGKQKLVKAMEKGQPFQLLLVGSELNVNDNTNWPALLAENIVNAYGEKNIFVDVLTYELTSKAFVEERKINDITDMKVDLVLLEPFTLKDNGVIAIEDSLEFIKEIVDDVKKSGATIILQPPHPLYNANLYIKQVAELEKFAAINEIPYVNHWGAWPDPKSMKLKEYITTVDNQTFPSKVGHEVWAKYLTDFFVAKEKIDS